MDKTLKDFTNYERRMEGTYRGLYNVSCSEKINVAKEKVKGVSCGRLQEYSEWGKCRQKEV